MSKRTLTTTWLDTAKCPEGKDREDVFDIATTGLCIRITREGRKTWSFVYTSPDTGKRARLGTEHGFTTYPALGLADARKRAGDALSTVLKDKLDPKHIATDTGKRLTVREVFQERFDTKVKGRLKTADEYKRRFEVYILPKIGDVPIRQFHVEHYKKVVADLIKRGKDRMAGMLYTDLRSLMNFAFRNHYIDQSQMSRVERPDEYIPRERALSLAEVRTMWPLLTTALPSRNGTYSKMVPLVIMLCLVLGQRIGEVVQMRRDQLDLRANIDECEWTIPGSETKNGREHVVPLSQIAVDLIRMAMKMSNSNWIFPNFDKDGCADYKFVDAALSRAHKANKLRVKPFTPHDLRRTMVTLMSEVLKVPELHISHVVNHVTETQKGITNKVYNKNKYKDEKRAALTAWGALVADTVGWGEELAAAA